WFGFDNQEAANGHIQAFEDFFPLGEGFEYSFLASPPRRGLVLRVQISKTLGVRTASNGSVYMRRGAQNLKIYSEDALGRLRRNKGLTSFETEVLNADTELVTNSEQIKDFMVHVVPTAEPEEWLKKQQMILKGKPTVASIVLFADEPQALL